MFALESPLRTFYCFCYIADLYHWGTRINLTTIVIYTHTIFIQTPTHIYYKYIYKIFPMCIYKLYSQYYDLKLTFPILSSHFSLTIFHFRFFFTHTTSFSIMFIPIHFMDIKFLYIRKYIRIRKIFLLQSFK